MLTVTVTILALITACVIVWFGVRRTRAIQRVSNQLSGPVEQMQEQLLLTADSTVDRLDAKIAQMEILLAEIDRRASQLAQHSQNQQATQQQIDQQQRQLAEWFQKQRQQLESEFALRQQVLAKMQEKPPAPRPPAPSPSALSSPAPALPAPETDSTPKPVSLPKVAPEPEMTRIVEPPPRPKVITPAPMRDSDIVNVLQPNSQVRDKRTRMLEMSEQGFSVTDIAQKMGVGKGEVMLLLKLRKKAAT